VGRDHVWDHDLRASHKHLPNLDFAGFLDQFSNTQLTELLSRSWILVNTSVREGLPTSFVEAAAHGCAILSEIDPDGFASQFGFHVKAGDYATGLKYLLANNNWASKGQSARDHTLYTFDLDKSIQRHIKIYRELIAYG
jgi:glycosyltransferase involved in cell wall biosynthesis